MFKNSFLKFIDYIFSKLKNDKRIITFIIVSSIIHAICILIVPILTTKMIDIAFPQENYQLFFFCLIGFVLAPLFSGILMIFEDYYANKLGHKVVTKIRIEFFLRNIQTKFSILQKNKYGEFIQRIIDEPEEIAHWIYIIGLQIIINFFGLVSTYIYLFYTNVYLGLIALAALLLYVIPYILFSRISRRIASKLLVKRATITQAINENLNNFYTIKSLGIEDNIMNRFRNISDNQMNLIQEETKINRNSIIILGGIYAISLGFIYLLGGWKVLNNEISVGIVIASKLYIDNIFHMVNQLHERLLQTSNKIPIASKLQESENSLEELETSGDIEIKSIERVEFLDVGFSFGKEIFRDFSWNVPLKMHTAIIGESGCGKSTLIASLTRIMIPNKGQILINKNPIDQYLLTSLRGKVRLVTQRPEIINGTIKENLLFGLDGINEADLISVIKSLDLYNFIYSLPKVFNTRIGSNEQQVLSGGQLQRLVIAKAILSKPDILILDEATSALDESNITLLLKAIEVYLPYSTVISSSHNIRIAKYADNILFYDNGRWVESTHEKLISFNPSYQNHFRKEI